MQASLTVVHAVHLCCTATFASDAAVLVKLSHEQQYDMGSCSAHSAIEGLHHQSSINSSDVARLPYVHACLVISQQ